MAAENRHSEAVRLASAIRDALIQDAQDAREQAAMSGLCTQGQLDLVMDRLRSADGEVLLEKARALAADESS